MKIFPTASIDAQVLMERYAPIQGQDLLKMIVDAAVSAGLPAGECKLLKTSTDLDIRVLCGNYHILVTQTVPFEANNQLKIALDSFSVRSGFAEAPNIVRATDAFTQISVQKGLIPFEAFPEGAFDDIAKDVATFCDSGESETAMKIVKAITSKVAAASSPSAVFWGPSLFLMTPDTFHLAADEDNPLLLYIHPYLYSEKSPETGEQLIGVIGSGAASLIGYTLEFKPSTIPTEYLVERLYSFVAFSLKRGEVFPDGDVFGSDANEKIQVIYHPSKGDGPEGIELKVVYNPAFGIDREPVPTVYKHYDTQGQLVGEHIDGAENVDLDPNDPIDAAILEQLGQQKAAETVPSADGSTTQTGPAHEAPPAKSSPSGRATAPYAVETQAPPGEQKSGRHLSRGPAAPRTSMDELRKFAIAAQNDRGDKDQKPSKTGGLLGRFLTRKK
jgi:hypothetical protein